jgi:hypothetical protein
MSTFLRFIVIAVLVGGAALGAIAQGADNKPITGSEDRPDNIKETLEKLRINRDKKDYDEMLSRSEEAMKLTADIERSFDSAGRLTPADQAKIANVEKLVKKIRNELGGDDDLDEKEQRTQTASMAPRDALKFLRESSASLFEQLKKQTRFSISASAIQCTNAILRLARALKFPGSFDVREKNHVFSRRESDLLFSL